MRALLAVLPLLLLQACVTPNVMEAMQPAWEWATVDRFQAACFPPAGTERIDLRFTDEVAYVGTQRVGMGCPEESPERRLMLQEANEGALEKGDEVLGAWTVDPEAKLGGDPGLTGLIAVRDDFGSGRLLCRGPFGWKRVQAVRFEYNKGSALRQLGVGMAEVPLLAATLTLDGIIGAVIGVTVASVVVLAAWIYLGCPGLGVLVKKCR